VKFTVEQEERDTIMFEKHTAEKYAEPFPGIRQKTLVFGERTLMTEFLLGRGCVLPKHARPYEQTGYLVKGHIILKIGESEHDTLTGDSWNIPMNVTHGAEILEDSVAIEVFSPVREDYLPK
jgi:quercetin dioxygenase-like cupin family protein